MSLLRWKELAKSKSELGNKINYVHNAITQHKIGELTSQESFAKVFQPVTSKLDDVIDSNLISSVPQKRRRPRKKGEVPDYGIDIDDEVEDMNLDDLFEEEPIPPEPDKQLGLRPPPYQPPSPPPSPPPYQSPSPPPSPPPGTSTDPPPGTSTDPPPEYEYDEGIDYSIKDEDQVRMLLDEMQMPNFEDVDYALGQDIINDKRATGYLIKNIKNAKQLSKQLVYEKVKATKEYNKEQTTQSLFNKITTHKRVDLQRDALKHLINYLENKKKLYKKGKGIKGRGILKKLEKDRNKIKGYKAHVTKKYNDGAISESDKQIMNKLLDDKMTALNKYIKDHKKKLELEKKIKGRKKQRGGNVVFFNDVKQLLNKLELIIGEVIAGNTSIQMRNTGVSILDMLLKMAKINRSQYNKLYNQYFKA